MKKLFVILAVMVMATGWAAIVQAAPVTIDNPNWYEFLFGGPGSQAGACGVSGCTPSSGNNSQDAGVPPWTFSGQALLTVTDAFQRGDEFQIFDNAVSIGFTSVVANTGVNVTDNPAVAVLDPLYSQGTFLLGAGSHSLTIFASDSPFGGGAAYFQVNSVPEPSALLLLGTGLLGLVTYVRRRKK